MQKYLIARAISSGLVALVNLATVHVLADNLWVSILATLAGVLAGCCGAYLIMAVGIPHDLPPD